MVKLTDIFVRIVRVLSGKPGEMVKTSVKQHKSAKVSYQRGIHEVFQEFLPQIPVQMHHIPNNSPTRD